MTSFWLSFRPFTRAVIRFVNCLCIFMSQCANQNFARFFNGYNIVNQGVFRREFFVRWLMSVRVFMGCINIRNRLTRIRSGERVNIRVKFVRVGPVFMLQVVFKDVFVILLISSYVTCTYKDLRFLFNFAHGSISGSTRHLEAVRNQEDSFSCFSVISVVGVSSQVISITAIFTHCAFTICRRGSIFKAWSLCVSTNSVTGLLGIGSKGLLDRGILGIANSSFFCLLENSCLDSSQYILGLLFYSNYHGRGLFGVREVVIRVESYILFLPCVLYYWEGYSCGDG